MAKKSDEFAEVKKLLDSIQQDVAGGQYVYRGTPEIHRWNKKIDLKEDEKRINSGIFRKYDKKVVFGEHYQPADAENDRIKEVRTYPLSHTSNLEILSDLRHFGGDTTLIDFSRDLLVALFFACNEKFGKDGELIVFPTAEAKNLDLAYFSSNDNNTHQPPKGMTLLIPAKTRTNKERIKAQKSIFIHAPEGFIRPHLCKIIPIKSTFKKPILDYLKKFHNIEERNIYPDLHGFIAAQNRFTSPRMHFYAGRALVEQKQYGKAVIEYNKAIRRRPDSAESYCNRGAAKAENNRLKAAIADFDEAIRLDPDFTEAYYNRGIAKAQDNKPKEAIDDFDKAIHLKPDYADAYHYRGVAKVADNRLEEAIKDFDEAVRLSPDYAGTYRNRGLTWEMLGEDEKARADFAKAEELVFKIPKI